MHSSAPYRKQHTMSGETRTYATYKEFCGNLEQPWVTRISEAVDWTQQPTTPDQAHIEAVLDTMAMTDASILHVGVGNSRFAQRFASQACRVDGLTVHQNEKTQADALGIPNYSVYVLNKHSPEFVSVITHTYDFIIDNNLASFACCKYHFAVMVKNYLRVLASHGQILTCQIGMDVYHGDFGCAMTYADLVSLENTYPVHVSKLTDVVYTIAVRR
jgi:hypothetical protein